MPDVPDDRPDRAAHAEAEFEAVNAHDRATEYATMRGGRQLGGVPGAMVAGLMVALRDIYETPKRDNGSVVVDSPSQPHDADRDGMQFAATDLDATADVTIAPLERRAPVVARRRSRLRAWTRRP